MKNITLILLILLGFSDLTSAQISWQPVIDIASESFGNNRPRMVSDADGNPLVVWGGGHNVMFSRWAGSGFSAPIQLNPESILIPDAYWIGPEIAAHGDTVYVTFKQTLGTTDYKAIWCVRSFDGGMSFSDPVRVDFIGENLSHYPVVTTDANGNPVIGFMRYNPDYSGATWVVARSNDFGTSFMPEVVAGNWSSATSEACDCCNGAMANNGEQVAMIYRDNNSNIRDMWAGISNDAGESFDGGINIDQQNWESFTCSSSGPDGIIIGDALYSVYMNGASGDARVYLSDANLSEMTSTGGVLLTDDIPGLIQQNFPRISNSETGTAVVWKQIVSGSVQLPILYTTSIEDGFSDPYEVIVEGNIPHADIQMSADQIYVVWQNNSTGTLQFRSGISSASTAIDDPDNAIQVSVYPNPSDQMWNITFNTPSAFVEYELFNPAGQIILTGKIATGNGSGLHSISNSKLSNGMYMLHLKSDSESKMVQLIKQQ